MSQMGFVVPGAGAGGFPEPRSGTGKASSGLPTSTVELSVRCDKLADKDVFSKSDPVCILFKRSPAAHAKDWTEVGRTERIKDNLNPVWQTKFVMDYSFEERQPIKFEVYDWDDKKASKMSAQDFLGRFETTLAAVVTKGRDFVAVLRECPSAHGAKLFVVAEELKANKGALSMQLAASKLENKDFLGKSDPFFVLSKATPGGQFVIVHKSETVNNNLNPTWAPVKLSIRDLCNNDYKRPLKIEIFDWDKNGSHDLIGAFKTDLQTLSTAMMEKKMFGCVNDKKTGKKGYKNSGEAYLKSFQLDEQLTFLDFVQGGTAINFSVAVDFTASNGPPADHRSLHFVDQTHENQYVTAIKAIGSIVEEYDTDKMIPGLGFGAKVPPSGQVSHEFFLNLHPDNPNCHGMQGLLQAYYSARQQVTLYGPTNFAPVIRHVSRIAQSFQDGRQYFILLIITDGEITDFEDTLSAIVDASRFPMSIIIVGVGQESFTAMKALDSDGQLLRTGDGRMAERDTVQFVPLSKFMRGGGLFDREALAKEVLAEVPGQLSAWMNKRGLKPIRS